VHGTRSGTAPPASCAACVRGCFHSARGGAEREQLSAESARWTGACRYAARSNSPGRPAIKAEGVLLSRAESASTAAPCFLGGLPARSGFSAEAETGPRPWFRVLGPHDVCGSPPIRTRLHRLLAGPSVAAGTHGLTHGEVPATGVARRTEKGRTNSKRLQSARGASMRSRRTRDDGG
jgi:hypothetical protein